MKYLILLTGILIICLNGLAQSGISTGCVNCKYNEISQINLSSAIGTYNVASGQTSFASGTECSALGNYSTAMGKNTMASGNSSFAATMNSVASGNYSTAFGYGAEASGERSFAIGPLAKAINISSIAIGEYVKSSAGNAIVIGTGDDTEYFENDVLNSLMIGFNSRKPTFFVGQSSGSNTSGRVGIGNVTSPEAKLHIKADTYENATLFLQSSDWNNKYAEIQLGTTGNTIKAEKDVGLTFKTEDYYLFEDGNVGIGTTNPLTELDINGNIMANDYIMGKNSTNNYFSVKGSDQTGSAEISVLKENTQEDVGIILNPGNNKEIHFMKDDVTKSMYIDEEGNLILSDSYLLNSTKLTVDGKISTSALRIWGSTSNGFLLASDDFGNAIWTDPQELNINDGDWVGSINVLLSTDAKIIVGEANNIKETVDSTKTAYAQLDVRSVSVVNEKIARFIDSEDHEIFFVPKLSDNGYNPISRAGDAGIFWNDQLYPPGQNLNAGFVIGPHRDDYGAKGIKIDKDGNVGIGTHTPDNKLTVAGIIHAQEILVTIGAGEGADFVFDEGYNLPELDDIDNYIKENKHLPDIPSAKEMQEKGLELGDMSIKLLQKIEELTLYVIEQNKKIEKMVSEVDKLKEE